MQQAEDSAATEFGFQRTRWTGRGTPVETYQTVLNFVAETIEYDRPTIYAAAEATSMNLRTLQRELANGGVTFEGLLDEYRLRRAVDYLRSGNLSITDIAFKLGYSDSAHFTRAFRRWTSSSPREFQRTLPHDRGWQHLC